MNKPNPFASSYVIAGGIESSCRGTGISIRAGPSNFSTIYAADEGWFAERKMTTHNIASISNPLSSPQGLKEVARMLADGTISARIRSTVELEAAGQMLDKLRHGALRGKGVIHL